MNLSEVGIAVCLPSGRVTHFQQPIVLDGTPFVIKYFGKALAVVTQSGDVTTILIYDPMGTQSYPITTATTTVTNYEDARHELLAAIIQQMTEVSLVEPGIVHRLLEAHTEL